MKPFTPSSLICALILASVVITAPQLPAVKPQSALLIQKTWGGSNSEVGNAITVDAGGNVYVTGFSESFRGGGHHWFALKYNSVGKLLWQRLSGSNGSEAGNGVVVDFTGNVYIAGWISGSGAGGDDVLLVKLNSTGGLIWQRTWGGANDDAATSVALDASGNIYLAGQTYSSSMGAAGKAFLLKFDPSGTIISALTWGRPIDRDEADGVAVDTTGNVYVAGYENYYYNYSAAVFLLKLNSTFGLVWQKDWRAAPGGTCKPTDVACPAVTLALDKLGNVFVGGTAESSSANGVFLLKFNPSGVLLWQTSYGSGSIDSAWGLATDSVGNAYQVGYSGSIGPGVGGVQIVKYDSGGNIASFLVWGGFGSSRGYAVALDSGGNICVTGFVYVTPPYSMSSFNINSYPVTSTTPTAASTTMNGSLGYAFATTETPMGFPIIPQGNQTYTALYDVFLLKYGLLPTIVFNSNPRGGSIVINGTTYLGGQNGNFTYGNYTAEATMPTGFLFSNWTTTGGVQTKSPNSNPTNVTVTDAGSLTANYKQTAAAAAVPNAFPLFAILLLGSALVISILLVRHRNHRASIISSRPSNQQT